MAESRRILVVDDDPYTRDLASTAIRGQGYEVVGAARMAQGLEAARALKPHLLLSDVVLPDGSGIDLACALRDELPKREMPIVALMSAFSRGRPADQRSMKDRAGAVAFLTKPLVIPALLDLIAQQVPLAAAAVEPAAHDPDAGGLTHLPDPAGADEARDQTAPAAPAAPHPGAPAVAPPAERARAEAPPPSGLLPVLANAWRRGWSGTLTVRRSSAEKRIALERGQIVWATTSLTDERLGRLILQLGWLPRDQYEWTLQEAARTGRRHGEILLERGFVTARQLEEAIGRHVEQIVLGALGWPEGIYRISAAAGVLPAGDRVAVSPIPRLVLRAFREVITAERLDAGLAALGARPIARRPGVPPAAIAQLAPSPAEGRFLEALATPVPLDRALAAHPEGPEAARQLLGALVTLGIVGPAGAGAAAPGVAGASPEGQPTAAHPGAPAARPGGGPAAEPGVLAPAAAGRVQPAARGTGPSGADRIAERRAAEEAARRLLEAEAAFEAGRRAAEQGDLATAGASLSRAVSLCPEEGEYRAWAAWVRAIEARAAFDRALDAVVEEMQAAAGLTPSSETIFDLIDRVVRLRTARSDPSHA